MAHKEYDYDTLAHIIVTANLFSKYLFIVLLRRPG